jgi:hypothetical protein
VSSVRGEIYSGSVLVLSAGDAIILVPGRMVNTTPRGTTTSSDRLISPLQTVSLVSTCAIAGAAERLQNIAARQVNINDKPLNLYLPILREKKSGRFKIVLI